MEEDTIRFRFEFTNEFGHNFVSESKICPWDSELMMIGEYFNIFLKQCGFVRKNDYILMDDITEEEYDALTQYLCEIRDKQPKETDV